MIYQKSYSIPYKCDKQSNKSAILVLLLHFMKAMPICSFIYDVYFKTRQWTTEEVRMVLFKQMKSPVLNTVILQSTDRVLGVGTLRNEMK